MIDLKENIKILLLFIDEILMNQKNILDMSLIIILWNVFKIKNTS